MMLHPSRVVETSERQPCVVGVVVVVSVVSLHKIYLETKKIKLNTIQKQY